MPPLESIAVRTRPSTLLASLGVATALLGGMICWRGLSFETGALAVGVLIALPSVIRRARDPRPLIVLDETGISDRRLDIGAIAWRDIRRVYARSLEGATFICLEFFEPELYLERMPFLRRVASQLWRVFGISPVHLATGNLDMRHKDLFELVRSRCETCAGRRPEPVTPR
jgi:hypothetical protein